MSSQFEKYLRQEKRNNMEDRFLIDGRIELYPKMIESLYQFLLQNDNYKEVEFGSDVMFKGNIEDYSKDYLKVIEFIKK